MNNPYDTYPDLSKVSNNIYKHVIPPFRSIINKKDNGIQQKITTFYPKEPKHYTQDWKAYNAAKTQEKIYFIDILNDIFSYIQEKPNSRGRPSYPAKDKLFAMCLQSYNQLSSRRCISDLTLSKKSKYITAVPYINSILNFYNDVSLVDMLKRLIQISGLPLKPFESQFAVDGSGLSTLIFERWLDIRTCENSLKRKWRKVHIVVGTRTNIITAVEITEGTAHDSPQFEQLLKETKELYDIKEISADMAYSSRKNLQIADDLGIVPYIPFRKNVKGNPSGYQIWREMFNFFKGDNEQFMEHYHRRSNVETTFSMIKQKFSHKLRCKKEIAQINEILIKCLCHNICCLIQEYFELNVDLNFNYCADLLVAQKK